MYANSSVIDVRVSSRAVAESQSDGRSSFHRAFAAIGARVRQMIASSEVADMPASDRVGRRQSDYERLAARWDGSPWNEISNRQGVWQ